VLETLLSKPASTMPAFDYWDLDEILAEQYEVTVKPVHDIVKGGILLPSGQATSKNLPGGPDGAKVQVPFWLAMNFARRNTATIDLPQIYCQSAQEDLQRDPAVCRLSAKSSYYFEVGLRLAYLLKKEAKNKEEKELAEALPDVLLQGLQKRWCEIVTQLGNLGATGASNEPLNASASIFPITLTKVENDLYTGTKEAEMQFKQWMENFASFKLKASSIIDAPMAKKSRSS